MMMSALSKTLATVFALMTPLHSLGGPSPVQYQHGTPALYQGQSGSPPPTGMPRVSIPTNQQAASARPTVPLAQGVPQQQQVTAKSQSNALSGAFVKIKFSLKVIL